MIDFKKVFKITIPIFAICLITALLLGLVNNLTIDAIHENDIKAATEARKIVVPNAKQFIEITPDSYKATNSVGETIGYAIDSEAKGYGGNIKVIVGFSSIGEITGIQVVSADDETPGLGSNVKSDSFLTQFVGKNSNVEKTDITTITSATYSSLGVINAVNQAIETCNQIIKGGN